jgi:soluble cytochrome b562
MKTLQLASILVLLSVVQTLRADEDTSLEGQMKILARGTKQLSQQLADPAKQQENIALLETLKKAATDSESLDPAKTKTIPEAGRSAFLANYKAELEMLKAAFDQVEQAVKAGDYTKAQSLSSQINPIKKEGHSKFQID